ncbi:MAG: hypothetical protein JW900_04615 [Anaerolineae bacterium]|nr:hypothetical protein [Anaerolineae bacterium]
MTEIGLLNEKPLHAALKEWYAQPGDQLEVAIDGFVIDIVRDDLLVEIQTRSFAAIKSKLLALARTHRIRLVYPIAQEKWIVKLAQDEDGKATRRKSPKRGRVEELFREMVSFPRLLANPNFSLEVLLIREEEVRRYDAERRWRRRRGWVTEERRLLEVVGRRLFEEPADWQALLPGALGEPFTTQDLAEAAGMRRQLAQKMAYCLRQAKVIRLTGKRGKANLYHRC